MVLGAWSQMEHTMRTSKDEPDRQETVVPRTMPQPAPQEKPVAPANDPAPQVVPERERKRA